MIIFLLFGTSSCAFDWLDTENFAGNEQPYYEKGTPIYADIDTPLQRVCCLQMEFGSMSLRQKKENSLKKSKLILNS